MHAISRSLEPIVGQLADRLDAWLMTLSRDELRRDTYADPRSRHPFPSLVNQGENLHRKSVSERLVKVWSGKEFTENTEAVFHVDSNYTTTGFSD